MKNKWYEAMHKHEVDKTLEQEIKSPSIELRTLRFMLQEQAIANLKTLVSTYAGNQYWNDPVWKGISKVVNDFIEDLSAIVD